MTFTSKKRIPKKVYNTPTTQDETIAISAEDPLPQFKPTPSPISEWLRRMPPVIEGMPTQREYLEWLPRFKKWLEEAPTLAK